MKRLFLSYNRQDASEVQAIRKHLGELGVSTFFDAADLPAGAPWFDELDRALRQVTGVAVFVGKSGLGTIQRREIQFALNLQAGKQAKGEKYPVIPVLMAGADPDQVGGFLVLN